MTALYTITAEGRRYGIIWDAEATNAGAPARVVYEALAVDLDETPADGWLDVYRVQWEPLQEWLDSESDDEREACDWDNPDRIIKDGTGYNITTSRIV